MMKFKKLFATESTEHTEVLGIVACSVSAVRVRSVIGATPWFFSVTSVAKKGFSAQQKFLILACCTCTMNAQAEPLGRLFHTPEQRALLDTARKTMPMNVGGEEQAPSAPDFTLKGVVTRSDGKRSVWLNGHMEHGAGRAGEQVPVQLPGGEVKLKVGQSIDPATGRVTESYRRPPPEPVVAKPAPAKETSKAPAPKPRDEDSDSEKPAP